MMQLTESISTSQMSTHADCQFFLIYKLKNFRKRVLHTKESLYQSIIDRILYKTTANFKVKIQDQPVNSVTFRFTDVIADWPVLHAEWKRVVIVTTWRRFLRLIGGIIDGWDELLQPAGYNILCVCCHSNFVVPVLSAHCWNLLFVILRLVVVYLPVLHNHVWARDAAFNKQVCAEREGTEMLFIFYNCIVPMLSSSSKIIIIM